MTVHFHANGRDPIEEGKRMAQAIRGGICEAVTCVGTGLWHLVNRSVHQQLRQSQGARTKRQLLSDQHAVLLSSCPGAPARYFLFASLCKTTSNDWGGGTWHLQIHERSAFTTLPSNSEGTEHESGHRGEGKRSGDPRHSPPKVDSSSRGRRWTYYRVLGDQKAV